MKIYRTIPIQEKTIIDWKKEVGTISYKENAIHTIREIRKKLSKEETTLKEINSL